MELQGQGQRLDVRKRSGTALDYEVRENIKLRKSNSTVAPVHAINTLLNNVKGSNLSKLPSWLLTVAWSLSCLHVIVCVALRCPEDLTKDLTLEVKAKDKDDNTAMFLYRLDVKPYSTQRYTLQTW